MKQNFHFEYLFRLTLKISLQEIKEEYFSFKTWRIYSKVNHLILVVQNGKKINKIIFVFIE